MFDTHCHLNFDRFKSNVDEVILRARANGVGQIVIPGTDIKTSFKALELAKKYDGVYAAVGVHPHHILSSNTKHVACNTMEELEKLLQHEKVVAMGEVGLDRYIYQKTKYPAYSITEECMLAQKNLLSKQIDLALKFKKSIIFHNREAKKDLLTMLDKKWNKALEYRSVFHCCEPDEELLGFAKQHHMFIGVDGDVTYNQEKKNFIKQVPLDMLVLETDSPYLLPEPFRSQKLYPNEPKNIIIIAEYVSKSLNVSMKHIIETTTENARRLFALPEDQ